MKTIKYMNFIFMRMYWLCLPICAFLLIGEYITFNSILSKVNVHQISYEGIVNNSNFHMFFTISLMLCLCIIPITIIRFYFGNKSIYTLLQTQPRENTLFYGVFISSLMIILTLWLSQIISIFICFNKYIGILGDFRHDGIFQSIAGLKFFRLIFPLCFYEWYKFSFIIISSALAVIFAVTAVLSYEYKKLIAVVIWLIIFISCINNFRINKEVEGWAFLAFILGIIFSIYFWISGKRALTQRIII